MSHGRLLDRSLLHPCHPSSPPHQTPSSVADLSHRRHPHPGQRFPSALLPCRPAGFCPRQASETYKTCMPKSGGAERRRRGPACRPAACRTARAGLLAGAFFHAGNAEKPINDCRASPERGAEGLGQGDFERAKLAEGFRTSFACLGWAGLQGKGAAQSWQHRAGFISLVNREAQRKAKGSTKGGKVSPPSNPLALPPCFFCYLNGITQRKGKIRVFLSGKGLSSLGAGTGKGGRSSPVPGRPLV